MIPPDFSFVRDGIPLSAWVPQLVEEDSERRSAAECVLRAMELAIPSVTTPLRDVDWHGCDLMAHRARLIEAIRVVVLDNTFDVPDFLCRACALELAKEQERQERLKIKSEADNIRGEKFDRMATELVGEWNSATEDTARREAAERMARLLEAYLCAGIKNIFKSPSGRIKTYSEGRRLALDALGPRIMVAPEAIEALLAVKPLRFLGLRMLQRAGSAAISMVPGILAYIDSVARAKDGFPERFYEESLTLVSIGGGNPDVVESLLARLYSLSWAVRGSAAISLRGMGTDVCGANARIVAAIWPMLDSQESEYLAISALASVGRDDQDVRRLVIERAQPAEPQIITVAEHNYQYDATMGRRGTAIDAIKYFTSYPAECIPTLIDAIDTFTEFDPDECHHGPIGRVARTLEAFGPAAAAAAMPLAKHLGDASDDLPRNILGALAAMGPTACEAVPLIEAYWRSRPSQEPQVAVGAASRQVTQLRGRYSRLQGLGDIACSFGGQRYICVMRWPGDPVCSGVFDSGSHVNFTSTVERRADSVRPMSALAQALHRHRPHPPTGIQGSRILGKARPQLWRSRCTAVDHRPCPRRPRCQPHRPRFHR